MERKFLEDLGIEKENINKILDQHMDEIGALNTRIKTKDTEIGTLRTDLSAANTKIAELEKIDVQKLQNDLIAERDGRKKDRQDWELRTFLTGAGCKDPDYLMYKLADKVAFAEDGSLKDKDSLLESCKKDFAAQFPADRPGDTGSIGNFARNREASGGSRREQLEKQANDTTLSLAQRIYAREQLQNLRKDD